jgi:hypothetical protein
MSSFRSNLLGERSAKLPGPPARTLKRGEFGWRPPVNFSRWLVTLVLNVDDFKLKCILVALFSPK